MIFNLFKSKPTLKELIPEGFVDIHSHVLPGIDDGAKDVEDSLKLISEMKKIGFSKIIGTPHIYPGLYNNSLGTISKAFGKIKNIEPNVSFAAEYFLDESLIKLSKRKEIICLKDNYILIEMSFINLMNHFQEIIFQLIINGYTPILAHPERYLYLNEKISILKKLKKMGCKFQINLLSTVDYYGEDVNKLSDKLYQNDLIDFVGTDIHNQDQINKFNEKILIRSVSGLEKSIENTLKTFG